MSRNYKFLNEEGLYLWNIEVIKQKADYLNYNPVVSGFVNEAWHWKYIV
jgi:putative transposase